MSAIARIPFHGTLIHTVKVDGEPHVVLRPTVEGIGLDYSAQLKKLKGKSWATVAAVATVADDGRVRDMTTVNLDTWAMLLANIDENRVADEIRPLVIRYQRESARALRDYWTAGLAVSSRAAENFFEPNTFTWDETSALIAQRFGIVLTVNELTRLLRAGGVLKQTGAPTKAYRHMFWFTGSAWNVHPHVLPQIAQKVYDAGRELQDFRFIQARLQLDGVGSPKAVGR